MVTWLVLVLGSGVKRDAQAQARADGDVSIVSLRVRLVLGLGLGSARDAKAQADGHLQAVAERAVAVESEHAKVDVVAAEGAGEQQHAQRDSLVLVPVRVGAGGQRVLEHAPVHGVVHYITLCIALRCALHYVVHDNTL